MIITMHIKLMRESCEVVGEKLRLVFSVMVTCDQVFFLFHFFLFLAGVKKSSLREHPVFSAQVSSFTRWMLSQAKKIEQKKNRLIAGYYSNATADNDKANINRNINKHIQTV